MSEELIERVIRVIADTQKIEPARITLDSSFEELGIDSLDGVNIVFALENEFDINIPDEDAQSLKTVRQVIERLEAWRAGATGDEAVPA